MFYYGWVVYAAATLDPCLSIVERNLNKSEEERDAEALASAFDKTDQFARYFERHLENKDYICGKRFIQNRRHYLHRHHHAFNSIHRSFI